MNRSSIFISFLIFTFVSCPISEGQDKIDVTFEVYEMPVKILEALPKYLNKDRATAISTFRKLASMGGVIQIHSIPYSFVSGQRSRIDQKEVKLEMDPVAGMGAIDLNINIEIEGAARETLSATEQVVFPSNQPSILNTWIIDQKAYVLFATALQPGKPEIKLPRTRTEIELYKLASTKQAEAIVKKADFKDAQTKGANSLTQWVYLRSGSRLRAGSGDSNIEVDLTVDLEKKQHETTVNVTLNGRSVGTSMATFTLGNPGVFSVIDSNGKPTNYVMVVNVTLIN